MRFRTKKRSRSISMTATCLSFSCLQMMTIIVLLWKWSISRMDLIMRERRQIFDILSISKTKTIWSRVSLLILTCIFLKRSLTKMKKLERWVVRTMNIIRGHNWTRLSQQSCQKLLKIRVIWLFNSKLRMQIRGFSWEAKLSTKCKGFPQLARRVDSTAIIRTINQRKVIRMKMHKLPGQVCHHLTTLATIKKSRSRRHFLTIECMTDNTLYHK